MKLYYSPGACSLTAHIALRESGVPFDTVKVNLKDHKTEAGADYYVVNPKGYVPTLELDNGERLTEVQAIVQYVADQKPESGLAPTSGTMERYRLQEWLCFVSSELHKQFSPLFNAAAPEPWKDLLRDKINKRFEYLAGKLKEQDYLTGSTFTVADAYLFVTLRWAKGMKFEFPAELEAFFQRVNNRPKVIEALQAEGLKKP